MQCKKCVWYPCGSLPVVLDDTPAYIRPIMN